MDGTCWCHINFEPIKICSELDSMLLSTFFKIKITQKALKIWIHTTWLCVCWGGREMALCHIIQRACIDSKRQIILSFLPFMFFWDRFSLSFFQYVCQASCSVRLSSKDTLLSSLPIPSQELWDYRYSCCDKGFCMTLRIPFYTLILECQVI